MSKKPEFTAGMKDGEQCVNRNGKFYKTVRTVAEAQAEADKLNKQHGMKTLYS